MSEQEQTHQGDDAPEHEPLTERQRHISAHREDMSKERALAGLIQRTPVVTWVVLAINIVLFGAAWLFGDRVLMAEYGFSADVMNVGTWAFLTGMKLPARILEDGQWWRIITAAFTHLSWTHILFNGYGLYAIGPTVEKVYGRTRWILIYVGTLVVSGLASLVFTDALAGGASGAIYGLVGALLVFGYKYKDELPERVSKRLTSGLLPWVVFGIGIGFFDWLPMDNAGHIGGVVSGAAFAWVMRSELVAEKRTSIVERLLQAAAAVCVAAVLGAVVFWGVEVDQCTASRDTFIQCYDEVFERVKEAPKRTP